MIFRFILGCFCILYSPVFSAEDKLAEERVIVDLPKTIYMSGEAVLFKVRLEYDGNISPSKIAYAELVDRNGQSVAREMIRIDKDLQDGYLDIPDNLISDNYLLRVYSRIGLTNPEKIFHQFVTVINPQKPPKSSDNKTRNTDILQKKRSGILEKSVFATKEKVKFTLPDGLIGEVRITVGSYNPFLLGENLVLLDKKIYKGRLSEEKVPELFGHVVKAVSTRQPMDTTETFFLSAHGTQSKLYTAKPNIRGELYFDLGAMNEIEYLIIQSAQWNQPLNALVESPFPILEFDPAFSIPELKMDESYLAYLTDLLASKEVSTYFYSPIIKEGNMWVTDVYPDDVFILDDYNRFDDIATTIREYVPKVRVRRQNKETVFRVFNDPLNAIFDNNPLILLDAMPIFNSDALAGFNPQYLQSLKLIYRDFYLNRDVFSGVMSLSSFDNNLGGFPIPPNALYIPYKGSQRPRSYHAQMEPKNLKSNFTPDFRTILMWENITDLRNAEGYFYTSEVTGPFEISIRFLDEAGVEQEIKEFFEVQFNP